MKRLYATTDPIEAEVLRALLRDAGIESSLDNQGGAAYAVGLPASVSPLGIHVSDEDAATAAEILARHFEKKDADDAEADPEAPSPLTPEEEAGLEEQIRRGKPRRRFLLAFVLLLPMAVLVLACAVQQDWLAAGVALGVLLGMIAVGYAINALARSGLKKKGPAPP